MRLYIDASFLLAIIMGEPDANRYARVWDSCDERCRTLDAIHVASALELNDHAGDFVIASLDERMREVASSVSLPLHPELEKI